MDRIITITGSDPVKKTLTLSDKGVTNAIPGDQVTWKIGEGSGVAAIVGIINKKNSPDVFSPDPHQLPGSTDWQGTVSTGLTFKPNEEEKIEEYSIIWNSVSGGGWIQKDPINGVVTDPQIRVKPQ